MPAKQLDWVGLDLSGVGIFAFVYGSSKETPKAGSNPQIVRTRSIGGLILVASSSGGRLRVPDPMMKIELFKIRNFWVGNVVALAVSFGMLGIFFPMTIFLQGVLGFSPSAPAWRCRRCRS